MVEKNSSQATIKDFIDGGGSALWDFEGGPKTDDWKSNPWRKDGESAGRGRSGWSESKKQKGARMGQI
jgi:hypothetical protein